MRSTIRSLAPLTLAAALFAGPAWAGGIPSPFGEPETSRPPARKPSAPVQETPPLEPFGMPYPAPAKSAATGTIDRTELPALNPQAGQPAPGGRQSLPSAPLDSTSRTVMREELAPVMAADGSGLPHELWRGLSVEEIEKLFTAIEIPPRSPALHELFRRLITSDVPPPTGGANETRFTALRIEALDRSGLVDEVASLLAKEPGGYSEPVLALFAARTAIARGDKEGGCRNVAAMNAASASLPASLKSQSILIRAYCSTIAGNRESAQLQVALARDEGIEDSAGLEAIDAIASGAKPALAKGQKVGAVDWRILQLGGPIEPAALIETAKPGLLAVISRDTSTDPALRLAAAEGAARFNAIRPEELASSYRSYAGGAASGDPSVRRAALFQSAEDERTPLKRARLIRSFLDDARRDGLYWPALQMIAPSAAAMPRVPEIGWFAETAIETTIASGDFSTARAWAEFGNGLDGPGLSGGKGYDHWLALADIADPALMEGRSRYLGAVEQMAIQGRLDADLLHRLATVLDALQVQVPIPLWEIASRAPQPATGHLPATGVLSELSDAAKKKEFGRTVLLSMQALGPNGAQGAHIISLGDSIRALRRAGLEADARRLALEAVFAAWPRTVDI